MNIYTKPQNRDGYVTIVFTTEISLIVPLDPAPGSVLAIS